MPNETIYLKKKNYDILSNIPGENVSQKINYIIESYKEQRT